MKKHALLLFWLGLVCSKINFAQHLKDPRYPQGYFQWPVDTKPLLVANFGELRPNHYHMGLDCKTEERENIPVLAAAEGYIAKVKIEPLGFGRAIYINHPNGLTTLYAHLNDFFPALEQYIEQQQYQQKQWKLFIDIPPTLFPVKKGDFIAYSGNTGASQGPHLHFEIRDTQTDKVLNPLLFGFPIVDDVAPDLFRLAVYDRNRSSYEQQPKLYPVKKSNGSYTAGVIRTAASKVTFAVTATDRCSGSSNPNGIYKAELTDNGHWVSGFLMDSISYDETRSLNAHIDYATRANGGPFLQYLSPLPGYRNGIYQTASDEDGSIDLTDNQPHDITITLWDAHNNPSVLQFSIVHDGFAASNVPALSGPLFKPQHVNVFENEVVSFYLNEEAIFDSFHFSYQVIKPSVGKPIYQLHNKQVPLYKYFPLKIKDAFATKDTGRIIMKRSWNNKTEFKKTVAAQDWYTASFRSLGQFQLILDNMPPVIRPIGRLNNSSNWSGLSSIAFAVSDNTEEIGSFNAFLDGQWLCFSNDKGKVFRYSFDEHCPPGEHSLELTVTDLAGNIATKTFYFTR